MTRNTRRTAAGGMVLMALMMMPNAAGAEEGPGTRWAACYAEAKAQNQWCHTEGGYFNDRKCDLIYQMDLFGCDAELVDAMIPIFN